MPDELLALAQYRGIELSAGPEGRLRWRCRGPLPEDLRRLLTEHKAALLELLPAPWDPVEADRLLQQVRTALAQAEAEHRAGRMTKVRVNTLSIWLEVAEGYVRDHELESRRGWDAMQLLRAAVRHAHSASRVSQTTRGIVP
jgi:hypothetical protein